MVSGGGGGTADNAKRPMALGEGGDKCKSCEAEQSVLGDKLETSVKSWGPRAKNPECSGRQLWETSVKSGGPASRVTSGRQA